jgi:predicted amidohydrolase YtcJ
MLGFILGAAMAMQSADTIFVNGRVYVQKGRFESALAVADDRKGTLDPDKLADLAIFAADLFKLEPRKILTTEADLTMGGGRVVFERTSPRTP